MLKSPKVVYSCNHIIDKIQNIPKTDAIQKSGTIYDTICQQGAIFSISSIYSFITEDQARHFYENVDFEKYGTNQIRWISGNRPAQGTTFYAEYLNTLRDVRQHTQEDCPRCGGNGWYVALFADPGSAVKRITGINKLVQDFIKILFTEKKDGYGSTLAQLTGLGVYDETELTSEIFRIVHDCEMQYKQIQSNLIGMGYELSLSERLRSVVITDTEYDPEFLGVFVSITLISEEDDRSQLNLKI